MHVRVPVMEKRHKEERKRKGKGKGKGKNLRAPRAKKCHSG